MSKENIFDLLKINGGFSNNIMIKRGDFGRGVFAINSSKKIELFLPKKLLIDTSYITLDKNYNLKLNDNYKADKLVKHFLNIYFAKYGFDINAKKEIDIFHNNIRNLSVLLKDYLKFFFNKYFFEQTFKIKDYFNLYLNSRQIKIQNKKYFMPLIELINHSTQGTQYLVSEGLYIKGIFKNEIYANYNEDYDSFEFFKNYNFFSKQKNALSCKLEVKFRNKRIMIERNSNEYKLIEDLKIPISGIIGNTIYISHINLTAIQINKNYYNFIIKDFAKYGFKYNDVEEFLKNLYYYNMNLLLKMKNECNIQSSLVATEISKIINNQIMCLSNK